MMFAPLLKNIKISVGIEPTFDFSLLEKKISKRFHNFFVVRENNYVYVIFPGAKHINITGIKCFEDIDQSVEKLFGETATPLYTTQIDNSTYCGKLETQLNLVKFSHFLAEQKIFCKYNPQVFPGLYFKLIGGTVIIFHTGKYNIVGLKEETSLEKLFSLFKDLLNIFMKAENRVCESIQF